MCPNWLTFFSNSSSRHIKISKRNRRTSRRCRQLSSRLSYSRVKLRLYRCNASMPSGNRANRLHSHIQSDKLLLWFPSRAMFVCFLLSSLISLRACSSNGAPFILGEEVEGNSQFYPWLVISMYLELSVEWVACPEVPGLSKKAWKFLKLDLWSYLA